MNKMMQNNQPAFQSTAANKTSIRVRGIESANMTRSYQVPVQSIQPVDTQVPISVNLHLIKSCNYKCKFCFATFNDIGKVKPFLALEDSIKLLNMLKEAGTEKVNFVGGEPTIHPHIKQLLKHSKELGFTVSIVSNGSHLHKVLDTHSQYLDWVGLSVDSAVESVQFELQRGYGDHVEKSLVLFERLNNMRIKTKLNTVVTRLNWQEDMSWFLNVTQPMRWKVFQVLPVDGQNDGKVNDLLITSEQFNHFLQTHKSSNPIAEDNDAMTSSYVMIDPLGRFFHNTFGFYKYSSPITEIGVEQALKQVVWDTDKFVERDGLYDWQ